MRRAIGVTIIATLLMFIAAPAWAASPHEHLATDPQGGALLCMCTASDPDGLTGTVALSC
jgi:hypothetical protein